MSNSGRSFFDDSLIDEIRAAVDIVDVIGEVVTLRRQGRNHVGLCPFHSEKTPSFSVSPDKQMFYCFGCGAGGSVFSFVQMREALSFPEAVRKLADRGGIKIPEPEVGPEEARRRSDLDRLSRVAEQASAQFQRWLWSDAGRGAQAYLKERGLDAEVLKRFQVGWAPPGWDNLLSSLGRRNVQPEWLLRAGLAAKAEDGQRVYDRFRERIIFPIWDQRGRTVAFGGRLLPGADDERAPKYLNSPETELWTKGRGLYPWHLARTAIRDQGRSVVVEGYMDVMTCHQAGFANAVAPLGTAFTTGQGRLLLSQASQVLVAYDADTAGQAAAERGIDVLAGLGADVRMVGLPEGKDPDDCIRSLGPDAFAAALESAVDIVEFRFRRACEQAERQYGFGGARTAAAVVDAIAPTLLAVESAVAREGYVQRFARLLGESEASLWTELRRAARSRSSGATVGRGAGATAARAGAAAVIGSPDVHSRRRAEHIEQSVPSADGSSDTLPLLAPAVRAAQEQLLAVMLAQPGRIGDLSRQVAADEFPSEVCRGVVRALYEVVGGAPVGEAARDTAVVQQNLVRVLEDSGQKEAAALVGKLLLGAGGPALDNPDRLCRDCVRALQEHGLSKRIIEVRQEVQRLERQGRSVPPELLEEYTRLVRAAKRNPPANH